MDKPKYKMQRWAHFGAALLGEVHGHPKFRDGQEVRTSTITSPPEGTKLVPGMEVETRNSVYILGIQA